MEERQNLIPEGLVAGRNPVTELLRSGKPVDKIWMIEPQGSLLRIRAIAREQDIPVKEVTREKLDAICKGLNHQGVAAQIAACQYATLDELFARAAERGEAPLFLIADNIEDPHNLGAILRSADATGVHGVIVPKRHGVGLTPAVLRASAGAALHIPVARVPNLAAAIETLKERGVWIYAADMGGKSWCSVDYAGGVALMIGSEGSGISRLLLERSDVVVSLPMCGKVNSLNASVAAGVLLYEIARQRLGLLPFASDHNRGQGDRNGQ